MRVAVVTSTPLFVEGGHLVIARALVQALRDEGYEAAIVETPQNRFGRQGAAYLATWLTDVGLGDGNKVVDRVISLRYPSYAVRHPAHACWLNHTMREYYDLWPRFRATLSPLNAIKEGARRQMIRAADRWLLTHNVSRVAAQSRTIQHRLKIELDGAALGRPAIGVAVPVDPGPHKVQASAPGRHSWDTSVEVGKDPSTQSIVVPVLAKAPKNAGAATPGASGFLDRPKSNGKTQRTIAYVLGGVGVVGLGVGTAFGLSAISNRSATIASRF